MRMQTIVRFISLLLVFTSSASPLLTARTLAAPSGVQITVTTGLDDDGTTCDSNSCTLRGAINKANTNGQTFNIIAFSNNASMVFVTKGPLPIITNMGLTINGSYNNTFPRIYGANGGTFFINADYVGLVFLTIVNTRNGPDIQINGGTNISIGNNYLGTVKGATSCADVSLNQGTAGVLVMPNNIGSASTPVAYIYGNVIACHQYEGIYVGGATVKIGHNSSDMIKPNYIGLMDDGIHAGGNGAAGVALVKLTYTPNDNLVDGNVISGNGREGIYVNGAKNTIISRNIIGINAFPLTTTTPIPNMLAGIALIGADSTLIGGGIALIGADSARIGLGNIGLDDIDPIPIADNMNLIAGNKREGIYVENSAYTTIDFANLIGGLKSVNSLSLSCVSGWSNSLSGVLLTNSRYSMIYPFVVGCNGGAGIATYGTALSQPNKIFSFVNALNGGLPIDRGNDGADLIGYPRITAVTMNGITPTVSGTACTLCTVYLYAAIGNPAASGGGGRLVGGAIADNTGQWSITLIPSITTTIPLLAPSSFSAHVVDTSNNSYEMSPRPQLFLPLIRR